MASLHAGRLPPFHSSPRRWLGEAIAGLDPGASEHELSMSRKKSQTSPRGVDDFERKCHPDKKPLYGRDHPALGMAYLWCELRRGGPAVRHARTGPRAGERGSVSAL